ncbi:hypothetical protein C8024_04155 [Sphingopyxis sp. BSNA05]|nr:hypothetical protein [Sphingopyxis sp. BSNA05]
MQTPAGKGHLSERTRKPSVMIMVFARPLLAGQIETLSTIQALSARSGKGLFDYISVRQDDMSGAW